MPWEQLVISQLENAREAVVGNLERIGYRVENNLVSNLPNVRNEGC